MKIGPTSPFIADKRDTSVYLDVFVIKSAYCAPRFKDQATLMLDARIIRLRRVIDEFFLFEGQNLIFYRRVICRETLPCSIHIQSYIERSGCSLCVSNASAT